MSGSFVAGSTSMSLSSAVTVNVSGSTFIFGIYAFNFMSVFFKSVQFFTATADFFNSYESIVPDVMEISETKKTEL